MNTNEDDTMNIQEKLQGEVNATVNEMSVGASNDILPSNEVIDILPQVIEDGKEE